MNDDEMPGIISTALDDVGSAFSSFLSIQLKAAMIMEIAPSTDHVLLV